MDSRDSRVGNLEGARNIIVAEKTKPHEAWCHRSLAMPLADEPLKKC